MKVPGPRLSKRRPSALARVLLWTFLIVLAGVVGVAGLGFYAQSEYRAPGPLAEGKVFVVDQGLSSSEIGAVLEQNGIISNARVFALMAQVTGQRGRLKAGEYAFPKGATMAEVMALIASGKAVTYKISIPEGFTSQMAVDRVNANEVLTGDPAAVPPEGSIMPDTYVFRRGMTRQKLVEDMQAAQSKLLAELWAARQPVSVIETPEQAVTLASIVEKETGVAAERPVIASVFINRLEKGMRLQSDPTIIYGIVGGKGRLDRPLTRADIETPTPYNTYRIKGLPPGPIANPGRAALEAVLSPEVTDKLYFVADGSGGHAFAVTLEEHNRNVRNWRQLAGNAAAAAAVDDDGSDEAAATPAPAPPPQPVPQPAETEPVATAPAPPPAEPGQGPLADVAPEPEVTPPAPAAEAAAPPVLKPSTAAPAPPVPRAKPQMAAVAPPPEAPDTPVAAPPPADAVVTLKPGTRVTVDGRATVIPRLRPAR